VRHWYSPESKGDNCRMVTGWYASSWGRDYSSNGGVRVRGRLEDADAGDNGAMISVRQATIEDLDAVARLFDAYRQFYRRASDPEGSRRFLRERFANLQSVIFVAAANGSIVGFTQLYPSFSSASMAPILILNDLFVAPEARRCGAASALLEAASGYGRNVGAVRLALSTEATNATAQAVYERAGWKRDTVFWTYQLAL
jgi:GNAT superfamily N-acetyltransferase